MKALTIKVLTGLALTASIGAAGATAASAHVFPPVQPKKQVKIVSGTATVKPSAATMTFLTKHHIMVAALGKATLKNGSLTFPVLGGVKTDRQLTGIVRLLGGVKFTKGKRALVLRNLTVRRTGKSTTLTGTVDGVAVRLARLTGVMLMPASHSSTITVMGEIHITAPVAKAIDRVAGARVVKAGYDLGSFTSTLKLGR